MSKLLTRCAGVFWMLACAVGQAATFTVTSFADSGPGTLREAITLANASPGSDVIRFASSGTIVLTSELPGITEGLEIDGTGHYVAISGNDLVPIMQSPRLSFVYLRLRRLVLAKATPYAVQHYSYSCLNLVEVSVQAVIGEAVQGGCAIVERSLFHGNRGRALVAQRLEIINSTFSNNEVTEDITLLPSLITLRGTPSGRSKIVNSTIQGTRVVPKDGAAVWVESAVSGWQIINNTIISGTVGPNCRLWEGIRDDQLEDYIDGGGNLSSDASCRFVRPTSLNMVDPLLGPLQNNGGPTMTMSPLTGSPAIDAGVNALAVMPDGTLLTTDQRGYARIVGASVDKGAYERAGAFNLTGLFQPLHNWPTFNTTQAGGLVPVRFGLNGYQGLAVFAKGYPISSAVACGNGPFTPIGELAQTGGGTLSYNSQTQRYEYVLKTEAAWKGSCRKVTMKFTDGSSIDAFFRFN